MKLSEKMLMACLAVALAGCGGGGSGGDITPTTVTGNGEGAYVGTVSNGNAHYTLVLEDGTYYSMYGDRVSGALAVKGFVQGTGTGSNGSFTSTNLKDFWPDGTVLSGSLSASYTATPTFNGSIIENGTPVTFTGTAPASSSYVYNQVPGYSNLVGTWSMTSLANEATTVTIAANNTYTASTGGCSFSGTITPRPSGKNVYNVTVTFGPAPCLLANQSGTGVAVDYLLSDGKRQLIVGAVDTARTHGSVLFGTK